MSLKCNYCLYYVWYLITYIAVLGIDSSSGSEIETALKPFENKKDEDSDEFDFYN